MAAGVFEKVRIEQGGEDEKEIETVSILMPDIKHGMTNKSRLLWLICLALLKRCFMA